MKPFISILFASIVTLGTAGAFGYDDIEDYGCLWGCCAGMDCERD